MLNWVSKRLTLAPSFGRYVTAARHSLRVTPQLLDCYVFCITVYAPVLQADT